MENTAKLRGTRSENLWSKLSSIYYYFTYLSLRYVIWITHLILYSNFPISTSSSTGKGTRSHSGQKLRPRIRCTQSQKPEPQNAQIGSQAAERSGWIFGQEGPQQHVLHPEQNSQTGLWQAQFDHRTGHFQQTGSTATTTSSTSCAASSSGDCCSADQSGTAEALHRNDASSVAGRASVQ